jgi:hypothetical protein
MKKRPEDRTGHPHYARSDPRHTESGPITRGSSRREGIPVPTANELWKPQARSWYNSLKLSGQSEFYEASDWATAVAAASMLDIFLRTYNASVGASFVKLSERLAVTYTDRIRARIILDGPDTTDVDEEAADNVIRGWQARLNAKQQRQD